MRRQDAIRLIVACALLAVLVVAFAGCGGGGGGSSTPPAPGVTLTIRSSTGLTQTLSTRSDTTVVSPLDKGATINVYDFATGQLITSGTIGDDGTGTVKVTSGLNVVVVVTGKRGGKDYRLSNIIPSVPNADSPVAVDPVSTITAEAVAAKYFKVSAIDQATLDAVKAATETCLDGLTSVDVSIGGGLVAGASFGTQGNLDAAKLKDAIDSVPATIDSALVKTKNAVAQIKDAGVPLGQFADAEAPSVESVFTACASAISDASFTTVANKYRVLNTRLTKLILPAINADMWNSTAQETQGIFDLTMGKGYSAILHDDYGWSWVEIEPNSAYDTAGKIVIKANDDGNIYVVSATKSGTTWTVTQTCTGDSAMDYRATVPDLSNAGTNPAITVGISIKDQYITNPITFNGSVNAVGSPQSHFTSITFTGSLSSDEVVAQGTFQANFPATVPTGATLPPGGIYALPKSVSMTNASCRVTAAGFTANLTGAISAQMTDPRVADGVYQVFPVDLSMTGGSISVKTNDNVKSISLSGTITGRSSWQVAAAEASTHFLPTELHATGLTLTLKNGSQTITATGSIDATAVVITEPKDQYTDPTHVKLQGTYTNSGTALTFNGVLEGTWSNPSATSNLANVAANVTVTGYIERPNYRPYDADLAFALNGAGKASCTINKLQLGSVYVTGSGFANVDAQGNVTNASLQLQNQDGVSLTIHGDATGSASVNGHQTATISRQSGALKIVYSDSTQELLPL